MKSRGFTLIEILGVVAILGIIALVAVPNIISSLKTAESNKEKSYENQVIQGAELYVEQNRDLFKVRLASKNPFFVHINDVVATGYIQSTLVKPDGKKSSEDKGCVLVTNNNGMLSYSYVDYDSDPDGCGKASTLSDFTPKYIDSVLNGADPVLDTGMIPVTIDNDGTVKKADLTTTWYDYKNKQWANAVVVKKTGGTKTRAEYQSAIASTPITASDILAYLVWIPRYSYKLFNVAWHYWYNSIRNRNNI
jgi:prepilin-type N-terminal cleavage/methylation domain-containing protein